MIRLTALPILGRLAGAEYRHLHLGCPLLQPGPTNGFVVAGREDRQDRPPGFDNLARGWNVADLLIALPPAGRLGPTAARLVPGDRRHNRPAWRVQDGLPD